MRHRLAKLGLAILVGGGGCSLIYNPSNLPKVADAKDFQDAPPPDTEIITDANPSAIAFDAMEPNYPASIDEGVGEMGSYPAIIELHGQEFTSMATVTFSPSTAVSIVEQKVSSDHNYIVLALAAPIDMVCDKGGSIQVAISVMQPDGMGGMAHADLDQSHFKVTCWSQLTGAPTGALDEKYSNIEIGTGLTFGASAGAQPGVILRSNSHITIGGDIVVSASMDQAGPGGSKGGAATANGSGPGAGKAGANNGLGSGASGGGGGFAMGGGAGASVGSVTGGAGGAMAGDPFIASYTNNHSSGGGGGGNGTAGSPGAGGGGGGSVELSATGDVTISGNVTANGGDGTTGTTGALGIKGGDGGAGSGGLIFLRSGATLTVGTLSVAPGMVAAGGTGSPGIIRVDTTSTTPPSGVQLGPMFVTPPKTVTSYPTIDVRSYGLDHDTTFEVIDKDNLVVDHGHTYTPQFGSTGAAQIMPVLRVGYNRLCALVKGNADYTVAEGTNCVEIGYAP